MVVGQSSPPVLEDPVVLTIDGGAIAHQEEGMVQLLAAALAAAVHSTGVELERVARAIHRNTCSEIIISDHINSLWKYFHLFFGVKGWMSTYVSYVPLLVRTG